MAQLHTIIFDYILKYVHKILQCLLYNTHHFPDHLRNDSELQHLHLVVNLRNRSSLLVSDKRYLWKKLWWHRSIQIWTWLQVLQGVCGFSLPPFCTCQLGQSSLSMQKTCFLQADSRRNLSSLKESGRYCAFMKWELMLSMNSSI